MKTVQCDLSYSLRTHRPTDGLRGITKLMVAFRKFPNASKNHTSRYSLTLMIDF